MVPPVADRNNDLPAEIVTNVPGRSPIRLVSYYEEFASYYPDCELNTKRWFVQNAGPDWTYLDCGANIGYYSILFSQLSPNGMIYAFEPTSTAGMLAENLRANCALNVNIQRCALGACSGKKVDSIFRIWGVDPETLEYNFQTIDEFVSRKHLDRVDCIKIDVDSFDFEVLRGAEKTLERLNPWVVVELNHALNKRNQSNSAAFEWLAKQGYEQALVIDHENFIFKRTAELTADECYKFQLLYVK